MTSDGPLGASNIGPRGRSWRKWLGWISLVVATLASVSLDRVDAPRAWRLGLFFPAWFGMLCLIQGFAGT